MAVNIGLCCPNLKIFDVPNAVNRPTECFIHLFYHNTYLCLHKYVYLPPHEVDSYHRVVHRQLPETEDIHLHSTDGCCPWCFDPCAGPNPALLTSADSLSSLDASRGSSHTSSSSSTAHGRGWNYQRADPSANAITRDRPGQDQRGDHQGCV